ncbi:hypothetical protein ODJ79_37185 [Actinoplanes sp. KI2]|uniref:hypothetical protein n=1 Tax=Actinoplanes sp. KI2 TaxID=2983315 RepID=UPI0021D6133E|nr:hypothetical protein [Actinoplanes sp. KI2]MCU7729383.1 hypothetical protein [Actinoplanes sp. KI2]
MPDAVVLSLLIQLRRKGGQRLRSWCGVFGDCWCVGVAVLRRGDGMAVASVGWVNVVEEGVVLVGLRVVSVGEQPFLLDRGDRYAVSCVVVFLVWWWFVRCLGAGVGNDSAAWPVAREARPWPVAVRFLWADFDD